MYSEVCKQKFSVALGVAVAISLTATLGFAKPHLDALAERLANLRTEVEALSAEVEQEKATQRARLRSVANQKADLEFQLQREQRRIAALRAQAEKKRKQLAEDSIDGEELLPVVRESMDELRGRIRHGLPFKRSERLGAVDELDAKIGKGLVTPQKGSVMLWALVEDELRLGRENGMYRQVIEVNDEEVLVDVVRLGMVAMYFRTDDGRLGRVERTGEAGEPNWRWVVETTEADRRQIDALFEASRKGIRTGYFQLPGPVGGPQ